MVAGDNGEVGHLPIAVNDGEPLRYRDLVESAAKLAAELDLGTGTAPGSTPAVAFLCPPGPSYVTAQWACWMAGGMAVPLHVGHPEPELRYCLATAEPAVVIAAAGSEHQIAAVAAELGVHVITIDPPARSALAEPPAYTFAPLDRAGNAMMVFTSGTTGKPKGVVTTHSNLEHQVGDLVAAWEWSANDKIPHFLPLHHVHGIVNKLLCPLSVGATVEFAPASAKALWALLIDNGTRPEPERFTLFMAVPTIYALMLKAMDEVRASCVGRRAVWRGGAVLLLPLSPRAPRMGRRGNGGIPCLFFLRCVRPCPVETPRWQILVIFCHLLGRCPLCNGTFDLKPRARHLPPLHLLFGGCVCVFGCWAAGSGNFVFAFFLKNKMCPGPIFSIFEPGF